MKVEVRLFALLERYLPPDASGDAASLDVPPGTTVRDVIELLEIPKDLSCLTVINGRDASPEQLLAPGDVLSMFPPLAGGA
jgi:molybdopterin converting factor small subunit